MVRFKLCPKWRLAFGYTIVSYTSIKKVDHTPFDLFPFSVYTGWVSVAAIADISYYHTYIEWDGFGISSVAWTIVLLIAATILAFVFAGKNRDWCYPLVFVWAFIGIGIRNGAPYQVITDISYILAALMFIVSSRPSLKIGRTDREIWWSKKLAEDRARCPAKLQGQLRDGPVGH